MSAEPRAKTNTKKMKQKICDSLAKMRTPSKIAPVLIFALRRAVMTTTAESTSTATTTKASSPDAIIVGSGLAGMSAALAILDRGGTAVVVEKEHRPGGNSVRASSGINSCLGAGDRDAFRDDTVRSASSDGVPGAANNMELIGALVDGSDGAVRWLRERVGVDLSLRSRLGGHAEARTNRPANGTVGFEIIKGMRAAMEPYEESGAATVLVDSRVTKLIRSSDGDGGGRITGVEIERTVRDGERESECLSAPNVILATGGFAADRSPDSYLSKFRPDLLNMPATFGDFSTGDGIQLAEALGAGMVDMDRLQVHPTGFVDPSDPSKSSKILAAELMRGVGGILIDSSGERFCNELGIRAYVTDAMLSQDPDYATTKTWKATSEVPTFYLILSSSAAESGGKHVDFYSFKGLLQKLVGVQALSDYMNVDVDRVKMTLTKYQKDAEAGHDEFGKTTFVGMPQSNLEEEVFFAGKVTPVLHYCMGGITIDSEGSVLDKSGNMIPGLHAAGEVAGGVHGSNRLAGNSLLECVVFGTAIGKKIPIQRKESSI